ncbi:glycosyltransferase family 4 protein [Patescibacteria group bacterium]|nr:glycosyltransferase family 4 protein [Patescibacteria group bacterium]
MKILLINKFYFRKGGAEGHYFDLKKLLEKNGHQVIPFAMENPQNLDTPYQKYFVSNMETLKPKINLGIIKEAGRIIWNWEAKRKIKQLIDQEKPDLAHIHNIYHQISPSILKVLKQQGIPVVMTVHDFKLICPNYNLLASGKICQRCQGGKYYNCLLQKCHKNSWIKSLVVTGEMYIHKLMKVYEKNIDWFVIPSRFFKDKLVEFGQAADKMSVLPNFVNAEKYHPSGQYENYVVFLGRLSREKGIENLLQAWAKVDPKLTLKVVGTGPEQDKLVQLTEKLNLTNVEFTGFLSGSKLEEVMRNCLFTVAPSVCYENCPLSLLESMAYGKAVVGSHLGGIPEIIEQKYGELIEAGDSDNISQRINYLFSHRDQVIKMGQTASQMIKQKYNPDQYYQQLMKIYEKISQQ